MLIAGNIHQSQDGRRTPLKKLPNDHLINIIAFIKRQTWKWATDDAPKYRRLEDRLQAIAIECERLRKEMHLDVYERELERRKDIRPRDLKIEDVLKAGCFADLDNKDERVVFLRVYASELKAPEIRSLQSWLDKALDWCTISSKAKRRLP